MKKRVWIMAILMAGTLAAGCGGASKDTMSAASVTEETSADYGAYENETWYVHWKHLLPWTSSSGL